MKERKKVSCSEGAEFQEAMYRLVIVVDVVQDGSDERMMVEPEETDAGPQTHVQPPLACPSPLVMVAGVHPASCRVCSHIHAHDFWTSYKVVYNCN